MIKNKNKLTTVVGTLGFLACLGASSIAQAVPWCHTGTIVQIANVNWSQAQIMANFTGGIPGGVVDPEVYTTYHSTYNYANTFSGGGGGFGGYSVPNSGQVKVRLDAPYTLTNMVGPGYYYTSQGVQFRLDKCYTIPPLMEHKKIARFEPIKPETGVEVAPYENLRAITEFWRESDQERDQNR
ncbi:hypothetical protein HWQ46_07285 [Shewanella sp. D64]|uniref:hypothetical protein n=1 Tax=unclassified Shewanella TaxID=196818 RepID=UPI0022BA7194|nr:MULTISPECIES: hypothetical protein [unclassified Shewanella]MEC4725347.1 hypothetical protein [Shewanella sp. D64]MEC4735807.1 hypothetical protein [Shewanella sp. E94]WBJ93222.1 hypothetical protein HWQ47_14785 [Shewanella sp. MTB7]